AVRSTSRSYPRTPSGGAPNPTATTTAGIPSSPAGMARVVASPRCPCAPAATSAARTAGLPRPEVPLGHGSTPGRASGPVRPRQLAHGRRPNRRVTTGTGCGPSGPAAKPITTASYPTAASSTPARVTAVGVVEGSLDAEATAGA